MPFFLVDTFYHPKPCCFFWWPPFLLAVYHKYNKMAKIHMWKVKGKVCHFLCLPLFAIWNHANFLWRLPCFPAVWALRPNKSNPSVFLPCIREKRKVANDWIRQSEQPLSINFNSLHKSGTKERPAGLRARPHQSPDPQSLQNSNRGRWNLANRGKIKYRVSWRKRPPLCTACVLLFPDAIASSTMMIALARWQIKYLGGG